MLVLAVVLCLVAGCAIGGQHPDFQFGSGPKKATCVIQHGNVRGIFVLFQSYEIVIFHLRKHKRNTWKHKRTGRSILFRPVLVCMLTSGALIKLGCRAKVLSKKEDVVSLWGANSVHSRRVRDGSAFSSVWIQDSHL
ncbi:hypothetical protein NPIL_289911 [Nephila pilipes]|uniref:Secreted protein n=1 Tax=Nephila pilipes TaxID=299642 RepID=A0A8X6PT33_NEPPI|nr:hypothetical protein NPIL_289911 [Nephila pilipes]